jgi:hypothetical protein
MSLPGPKVPRVKCREGETASPSQR